MAYSDFTLDRVRRSFNLTLTDRVDIFANVSELECSEMLAATLRRNVHLALASNTEKSRSEMIIAPILIELRSLLEERISLFSGIDFTVDAELGLNGSCDFIISRNPELLILTAPVMLIVEAKKENINAGLGQCVAEMVAASLFNSREGNEIKTISGVVTTGTAWKFLKLEGQLVSVDLSEYYLNNVNKIMGILASGITDANVSQ